MKSNYYSKVENKYVFNLALFFWHFILSLISLIIIVSIGIIIWSLIPSTNKVILKQPYPDKTEYPEPVKVSLDELGLEDVKLEKVLPESEQTLKIAPEVKESIIEDTIGKSDYKASINKLKTLIPPSKYSKFWKGSGKWTYPKGKRYWKVYKKEKYRKWVVTKQGVNEKLKSSLVTSNAINYSNKKYVLDSYISILESVREKDRLSVLMKLFQNTTSSITRTVDVNQSIKKCIGNLVTEDNIYCIEKLSVFGIKNPNDGVSMIEYISNTLENFQITERRKIINTMIFGYYKKFNENLIRQQEATNSFIVLLPEILAENQPKALLKYYDQYLTKNADREQTIKRIDREHEQQISEIDNQYNSDQNNARGNYEAQRKLKSEYRYKSMLGIGSGILAIVLIAIVLVFLSIQRSVRKIEKRLSN